jgi:hypothetical protein
VTVNVKRVALAMITAGLIAAPPAQAELPKLSHVQSIVFMDQALHREFGGAYDNAYQQIVRCSHRLSPTKMKCQHLEFGIGDSGYKGVGRIWLSVSHSRQRVLWNYAFRIEATNYYCLNTGGTDCVDTIRVQ